MDYADILNDLIASPPSELSELELDVLVIHEFEIETLIGGSVFYFDSSSGDNIDRLREAASRHSFSELSAWMEQLGRAFPQLLSPVRDVRAEGLARVSEEECAYRQLTDHAYTLAEDAGQLCERLVLENQAQLEAACLARR